MATTTLDTLTPCRPPFDADGMNLDVMSYDDIHTFIAKIGPGVRPITAARALFPHRPKEYVTATCQLRNYAWNKVTAISCRKRGDIRAASVYEDICDRIYSYLPDYAKFW